MSKYKWSVTGWYIPSIHSEVHNMDIYKLIYDKCKFNLEWTGDLRDHFKFLLMPIYMLERSVEYRCAEYNKKR